MASDRENEIAAQMAKMIQTLPAGYDQEEVLEKVVKFYFGEDHKKRLKWVLNQSGHAVKNWWKGLGA